jgi:hypothetical protein
MHTPYTPQSAQQLERGARPGVQEDRRWKPRSASTLGYTGTQSGVCHTHTHTHTHNHKWPCKAPAHASDESGQHTEQRCIHAALYTCKTKNTLASGRHAHKGDVHACHECGQPWAHIADDAHPTQSASPRDSKQKDGDVQQDSQVLSQAPSSQIQGMLSMATCCCTGISRLPGQRPLTPLRLSHPAGTSSDCNTGTAYNACQRTAAL